MKITITQDELNKYWKKYHKEPRCITGLGDIANDLGECVGAGSMEDESWYFEAIWQAEDEVRKQYNFEADILEMKDKRFNELCAKLEIMPGQGDKVHTLAACMALNNETGMDDLVSAARDADKDEMYPFFLDYEKEVQRYADSMAEEMRREFIRGDYHGNYHGIERDIEKLLNAEDATVEGYDAVTIEWDDAEIKELIEAYYGRKDIRMAKKYAMNILCDNAAHYKNKRKAENEKHRAEREKTEAYQKERKEEAAKERKEMLDKIRI